VSHREDFEFGDKAQGKLDASKRVVINAGRYVRSRHYLVKPKTSSWGLPTADWA
jgi:hypothetical protein